MYADMQQQQPQPGQLQQQSWDRNSWRSFQQGADGSCGWLHNGVWYGPGNSQLPCSNNPGTANC
jgi:hypothetical protein